MNTKTLKQLGKSVFACALCVLIASSYNFILPNVAQAGTLNKETWQYTYTNEELQEQINLIKKWNTKESKLKNTYFDDNENPTFSRLAGGTAMGTMKAIVNEGWDTSDWAIIARADGYHDALAASGLAGILDCPIMLTNKDDLNTYANKNNKTTQNLLQSKQVKNVLIVGGKEAVSSKVEQQLKNLGLNVERAGGTTAAKTAIAIYNWALDKGYIWSSDAIVATSTNYQDALSISPYAYAKHAPVFLTNVKSTELGNSALKIINSTKADKADDGTDDTDADIDTDTSNKETNDSATDTDITENIEDEANTDTSETETTNTESEPTIENSTYTLSETVDGTAEEEETLPSEGIDTDTTDTTDEGTDTDADTTDTIVEPTEPVEPVAEPVFTRTIICGGQAAVNANTESKLTTTDIVRKGGGTGYSTSKLIAEFCLAEGMQVKNMGVASARKNHYQDALCGGALCGKNNAILLLSDDGKYSTGQLKSKYATQFLNEHKAELPAFTNIRENFYYQYYLLEDEKNYTINWKTASPQYNSITQQFACEALIVDLNNKEIVQTLTDENSNYTMQCKVDNNNKLYTQSFDNTNTEEGNNYTTKTLTMSELVELYRQDNNYKVLDSTEAIKSWYKSIDATLSTCGQILSDENYAIYEKATIDNNREKLSFIFGGDNAISSNAITNIGNWNEIKYAPYDFGIGACKHCHGLVLQSDESGVNGTTSIHTCPDNFFSINTGHQWDSGFGLMNIDTYQRIEHN